MNNLTLFDYYTNKDLLQCITINFLITYAIKLLYESSIIDAQYISYITSLSITVVNIINYSNFVFNSNIYKSNLIKKNINLFKHYLFSFIVFFTVFYINLFIHVLTFNIGLFYTDIFIKFLILYTILYTVYFILYFIILFSTNKTSGTRSLFFIVYLINLSTNLALIFTANTSMKIYEFLSCEFLYIYELLLNMSFVNINYIYLISLKILLILISSLMFRLFFEKRA